MEPPAPRTALLTADRVAGLALIAFGALALVESRALPLGSVRQPGPAAFPGALSIALIGFGALLLVFSRGGAALKDLGWQEARQALLIVLGAAAAILLLERAGYVITLAALLLYLLIVVARRHWAVSSIVAVGLAGGTFALFDLALRVPLPRSPLGYF